MTEKQEQNDGDENRAVAQRLDHVVDGEFDEIRLPENAGIGLDTAGKQGLHFRQRLINAPRQFERIGVRLFLHGEDDRRAGIHRGRAQHLRGAGADVGHLLHQHGLAVAHGHDRAANVVHIANAADAANQVFLSRGDIDAAGGIAVAGFDGLHQFVEPDAVGGEAIRDRPQPDTACARRRGAAHWRLREWRAAAVAEHCR